MDGKNYTEVNERITKKVEQELDNFEKGEIVMMWNKGDLYPTITRYKEKGCHRYQDFLGHWYTDVAKFTDNPCEVIL